MDVRTVIEKLELTVHVGDELLSREVSGGYVADLLSNVMANAKENEVWVTVQVHPNVVAVASLLNLAAIIITGTIDPGVEIVKKAKEHEVILLTTTANSFAITGRLYQLGLAHKS